MSNQDGENIEKIAQTAALLVADLQALHRANHPLLTELAYGLLENAATLKSRLDRILVINAELPDLILADMTGPVKFFMSEVVATDGAVTEMRKQALLGLVRASRVPEDCVEFLSVFEDREARPFARISASSHSIPWCGFAPNPTCRLS